MTEPFIAITIIETERAKDDGYIPCFVKKDETGFFRSDWNWGSDLKIANQCANDYNKKLRLTKQEAIKLVLQSLPGSDYIHKELDGLKKQNSEAVLDWIREHVSTDLDLVADINPADIQDSTLEWD